MAGQGVGRASVEIVADGGRFGESLAGEVDKASGKAEGASKRSGSKVGGFFAKSFKTVAKVGLVAGGAVVGAAMGQALMGGFNRLVSLDQARTKFTALGLDADKVMKSVSASVEGTAFSLDAAAASAASFLAGGVKPGKDLETILKSIGDAAAFSGREFGDVGTIYAQVFAKGKLQGDDMLQIMDSGIPIVAALAKQMGVASTEVADLASKGKISFETFRKAMDATLGGQAQAMGKTFMGALGNMKTSLSRFGAVLLGPIFALGVKVFPLIQAGVSAATKAMQPFADAATAWVSALDFTKIDLSFLEGLKSRFAELPNAFSGAAGAASSFGPQVSQALGTVRDAVQRAVDGVKALLPGFVDGLTSNVLPRVQSFASQYRDYIEGNLRALAPAVQSGVSQLAAAFNGAWPGIQSFGSRFGDMLGRLADGLLGLARTAAPAIAQVVGAVGGLVAAVLPVLLDFARKIAETVGPGLLAIGETITQKVLPALSDFVGAAGPALSGLIGFLTPVVQLVLWFLGDAIVGALAGAMRVIDGALSIISGIFNVFTAVLSGDWSKAWQGLVQILQGVWDAIIGIIQVALNVGVLKAFKLGWTAISGLWKTGWTALKTAAQAGLESVKNFLTGAAPSAISRPFAAAGQWLLSAGRAVITGLINGIRALFGGISTAMTGARNAVINAMRSAASWLVSAGQNIVVGLINGMTKMFQAVWNRVSQLGNFIRSAASGLGGILYNAGVAVIQGFIDGIQSGFGHVRSQLNSLTNMLPSWKGPAPVDKVILRGAGQLVMRGFTDGLVSEFGNVKDTLGGFTSQLGVSGAPTQQVTNNRSQNITLNVSGNGLSSRDTIDEMMWQLKYGTRGAMV